jgi:uncharacterized protein
MTSAVPSKRLLASIHDVGPRFEREVDFLVDLMVRHCGEPRFAMLVVPNHWNLAPLSGNPAFKRKVRAWSDAGIEMFVHGWYHRDEAEHRGLARLKAGAMTASEGEFLGLSEVDAATRMRDGKALIEDITGREAAGFIAPAWLYGPGAMAALTESKFVIAEDHFKVWKPAGHQILARGPVITWASRSRARIGSSLAAAGLARIGLQGAATVRVAVHPGDMHVPALVKSIERTLSSLMKGRCAGRYADLLARGHG